MRYKKIRIGLLILVATLLASTTTLLAHSGDDGWMHHEGCGVMEGMMYGAYGPWMMILGWLFSIVIFVALILAIVWLIKQLHETEKRSIHHERKTKTK